MINFLFKISVLLLPDKDNDTLLPNFYKTLMNYGKR